MNLNFYLKIGSGSDLIIGDSRDPHHVGWFKLFHFILEETSHQSGAGTGVGVPLRFRLEIATTKNTVRLTNLITTIETFSSCTVDVADAETGIIRYRHEFEDVRLGPHGAGYSSVYLREKDIIVETFAFECKRYLLNQSPVADDAAQQMVLLFEGLSR